MKKWMSLLLALVMTMSLVACGGGDDAGTSGNAGNDSGSAAATQVLYHSYNTAPYVTLDPSSEYSNGIMTLQNVYETLTRYNDETEEVDGLLATEWTASEDGMTWVFQLREDVTFHDGAKMNAEAVVGSIQRTIDKGQGAAFIWSPVASIEATGEYEVTFTLSYAAPMDLICSAGYAAYIMSPNVLDKDTEWFNEGNDGGSGPYMISKATGDSVILTAYEDYRGGWTDKQFKNVLVKEVPESSARRQLVETGESQFSSEFSSTDRNALMAETDKVYSIQAGTFNNILVFLNSAKAPCDNADFRRALQYAFPFEETVEGVLEGNAQQSVGLVPHGLWSHDDTVHQYSFDLEKAQEYLDKSGVDVTDLSLTVTYMNGYDEYASFLQLYQSNLKKLGINLELRSMEWDEQWADAQAPNPDERQDMFVMIWWPDYASPNSWFNTLIHSEDTIVYNMSYINDPELDAKMEQADILSGTDREAATKLYQEIQHTLADEAYIINAYDQTRTYIINNSITGVHENPAYSTAVQYYNVTLAE